jgi:hypothetical protein
VPRRHQSDRERVRLHGLTGPEPRKTKIRRTFPWCDYKHFFPICFKRRNLRDLATRRFGGRISANRMFRVAARNSQRNLDALGIVPQ